MARLSDNMLVKLPDTEEEIKDYAWSVATLINIVFPCFPQRWQRQDDGVWLITYAAADRNYTSKNRNYVEFSVLAHKNDLGDLAKEIIDNVWVLLVEENNYGLV